MLVGEPRLERRPEERAPRAEDESATTNAPIDSACEQRAAPAAIVSAAQRVTRGRLSASVRLGSESATTK